MSRFKNKIYAALLIALILGGALLSPMLVSAQAYVGLTSPETVQRGSSFIVSVVATGATSGVAAVQLYLQYPQENFTFVKANSTFLGTAGGQIADPDSSSLSMFVLQDTAGGVIQMAYAEDVYYPPGEVIAELEFTAKTDALIGPTTFNFRDNSFILLAGEVKVPATLDSLKLEVVGDVSQPLSDEPLPPPEMPAEPPTPSINEPYNQNDQIAPVADLSQENPANYDIGKLAGSSADQTSETSEPETTTSRVRETENQISERESKEVLKKDEKSEETPLRSVTGAKLYLPEGGLDLDKIPAGFKGGTEEFLGLNIPVAKSEEKELTLYYLAGGKAPAFYTYQERTERFKLFDLDSLNKESSSSTQKSRFTASNKQENTWKILLVSLIGLSSLSVFIYSLSRNLQKN